MRYAFFYCLIFLAMGNTSCTHFQLSRSTLRQASTITDLQYQQVLSNLASFHASPEMLPHIAVVGTGGTSVNDEGSINVELEWDPTQLVRRLLGIGATRGIEEQWTLAPVVNPDKLRAIRCAFQLVAVGKSSDRECDALLQAFLGDQYMEWIQRGWYCVGSRHEVPHNACYVAHCGHKYVWVMPEGVEGLSRLTLVVLNIATLEPNPPPEQPTKMVQKHIYKDGKLDSIETYTRPDPDAPKITAPPIRRDFYNPLQAQIQMGGKRR